MKRLVVMLLVVVGCAFAQEPVKFRGAWIGQPLSDYVDCSSGKAKKLLHDYRTHGNICAGKRGIVFHTKTKGFMDPKTEGESYIFEDAKLVRITLLIPNEDWEKVKYDLSQKLGPPTSEVPEVYQNGFGARWEFSQGFWVKGDTVVVAGINVEHAGGIAIPRALGNSPATSGIQVTITDAQHAKLPSTTPSTID